MCKEEDNPDLNTPDVSPSDPNTGVRVTRCVTGAKPRGQRTETERLPLRHHAKDGRPIVRQAGGGVTMRGCKKRMPDCNGRDRA